MFLANSLIYTPITTKLPDSPSFVHYFQLSRKHSSLFFLLFLMIFYHFTSPSILKNKTGRVSATEAFGWSEKTGQISWAKFLDRLTHPHAYELRKSAQERMRHRYRRYRVFLSNENIVLCDARAKLWWNFFCQELAKHANTHTHTIVICICSRISIIFFIIFLCLCVTDGIV